MNEDLVTKIIKAVRALYSHTEYKSIVDKEAKITFRETRDGYLMTGIEFYDWDSITVSSTSVTLHRSRSGAKKLLEYKDYEELIGLVKTN